MKRKSCIPTTTCIKKFFCEHYCIQMTNLTPGTIGKCPLKKEHPVLKKFALYMNSCFVQYNAPLEKSVNGAQPWTLLESVLQPSFSLLKYFLLQQLAELLYRFRSPSPNEKFVISRNYLLSSSLKILRLTSKWLESLLDQKHCPILSWVLTKSI